MNSSAAKGLTLLHREAMVCQKCELWRNATQAVFGAGPPDATLVFVGEQPGDREDLDGRPFVGPAGAIFDRALGEAGIDRARAYVTNAVKHFKNEPRGKRRIHMRPNVSEIKICRWWLEREIAFLRPRLTVALGATAAYSLFGKTTGVRANRGMILRSEFAGPVFVTVHPSSLLRQKDAAARQRDYADFIADLRHLKKILRSDEPLTPPGSAAAD